MLQSRYVTLYQQYPSFEILFLAKEFISELQSDIPTSLYHLYEYYR